MATISAPQACASELLDVVPAIMRVIRAHMREASSSELSVPQFRTLRFLSCRKDRSVSDVAEHIGLSLPSASKLVQQLLERGYVHRAVASADRRRTVLAPTAKGARVLQAASMAARDRLAEMVAELANGDRESVIVAMRTLRSIFSPELTAQVVADRLNGRNDTPERRR